MDQYESQRFRLKDGSFVVVDVVVVVVGCWLLWLLWLMLIYYGDTWIYRISCVCVSLSNLLLWTPFFYWLNL